MLEELFKYLLYTMCIFVSLAAITYIPIRIREHIRYMKSMDELDKYRQEMIRLSKGGKAEHVLLSKEQFEELNKGE